MAVEILACSRDFLQYHIVQLFLVIRGTEFIKSFFLAQPPEFGIHLILTFCKTQEIAAP